MMSIVDPEILRTFQSACLQYLESHTPLSCGHEPEVEAWSSKSVARMLEKSFFHPTSSTIVLLTDSAFGLFFPFVFLLALENKDEMLIEALYDEVKERLHSAEIIGSSMSMIDASLVLWVFARNPEGGLERVLEVLEKHKDDQLANEVVSVLKNGYGVVPPNDSGD